MMRLLCLLLLLSGVAASAADWDRVDALYAQARFDQARVRLAELATAPHDTFRAELWRYRLAEDSATAESVLDRLTARTDLPGDLRDGLLVDAAWRAFGAREDERTLDLLRGVPLGGETRADAGYLAGLAWRALGNTERSAAALAAVQPSDPDFAWARLELASLAANAGDVALSRRYLQTAESAADSPAAADALALRWTLIRDADPDEAERVGRELAHRFPRSLAAARIDNEIRRREDLAHTPPLQTAPAPAAGQAPGPSRFELQLAAFTDRGRAIAFRDAWRDQIPDLRVVADRDEHGRGVFRLRAGRFATRPEAASLADALRRDHDLESIVVQVEASP